MSALEPGEPLPDDEPQDDAAIVRLGHHAIGLWRAAQECGHPDLLGALRPILLQIGRAVASDLMTETHADETQH